MTWPLQWMPAYSHGGLFTAGNPIGVVIHSTESADGPGSAESIAGPGWFGGQKAGTSAHKIVDQNSIVEGVKRNTVAWHVGPQGNGLYIGYEFCGMAEWTAAQWNAPENLAMISGAAPFIADDLKAMGAPARWLSLTQVAQKQKGLLTHNDVRLALGGTTHSDPGPNFPYAFLLSEVQKYLGGTPAPAPTPAPPAPAPQPAVAFPYPHDECFGLITDPSNKVHGGINAKERTWVKQIQQKLQQLGFAPKAAGWADGKYEQETVNAVAAWQHAKMPGTTIFGQVWFDDWAALIQGQYPAQPAPRPAPSVNPDSLPTMAFSETSDNVKKLQAFLNAYNWRPALPLLPVTGYFGPSTASVLHHAGQQLGVAGDVDGRNFGPHFKAAFARIGFHV